MVCSCRGPSYQRLEFRKGHFYRIKVPEIGRQKQQPIAFYTQGGLGYLEHMQRSVTDHKRAAHKVRFQLGDNIGVEYRSTRSANDDPWFDRIIASQQQRRFSSPSDRKGHR